MLCIKRHENIITIGGLDYQKHIPSSSPPTPQYGIVLSWGLLDWILEEGRIQVPCSFTNFITTPELSGPFCISPDYYHAQIIGYLLHITYR